MLSAKTKKQTVSVRKDTVKFQQGYLQGLKYAGSASPLPHFQTLSHIYNERKGTIEPVYGSFESTTAAMAIKPIYTHGVRNWNIMSPEISKRPDEGRSKNEYNLKGDINIHAGAAYTPKRVEHIICNLDIMCASHSIVTLQEFSHTIRKEPKLIEMLNKHGYAMCNTSYGTLRRKDADGVFQTVDGFLGCAILIPPEFKMVGWKAAHPYVMDGTKTDAIEKAYGDRKNVYATLEHRTTGQRIVVAAIHCPCEWRNPELLQTLVKKNLESAKSYANGLPLLIGADLNADYPTDCMRPFSCNETIEKLGFKDLLSDQRTSRDRYMYNDFVGKPTAEKRFFTNIGSLKDPTDKELRCLDLDYILYSEGSGNVTATQCDQPYKDATDVLPNATHPSDHYEVWASITFGHSADPKTTSIALELVTERLLSTKITKTTSRRKRASKKHMLTFE